MRRTQAAGRTLASRADLDTRWKLSKEFAATLTYFLASGFMFVESVFTSFITIPGLQGVVSDVIKLLLFPFIAFIMVLNYLYKSRKALKEAEIIIPEEEVPEVEPSISEEEPVESDEPEEEEEEVQPFPDDEDSEEFEETVEILEEAESWDDEFSEEE